MSATNGHPHRQSWRKRLLAAVLGLAVLAPSLVACSRPEDVEFPNARIFGLSSVVTDTAGDRLGIFAAPGEKPGSEINYLPVAQSKIVPVSPGKNASQYIGWAFIDAEDATFYSHKGSEDAAIIKRAADGGGGSTLEMQLMYIRHLQRGETLLEKIQVKDQVRALALKYDQKLIESGLSKREAKNRILGEHANETPYCRQSRGVEAASLSLFGHGITSSKFNLAKAVILAALLKDPCYYTNNAEALQGRCIYVLNQMLRYEHISSKQYEAAKKITFGSLIRKRWSSPPTIASSPEPYITQLAPMWLGGQFKSKAEGMLKQGDLSFQSTTNRRMQNALNKAVQDNLPGSKLVAGAIIIDANDGEIKALYGGNRKQYSKNQRNYAVTEPRRGGSTSKVFTLAKAFENGRSPEDKINCPAEIDGYQAKAGQAGEHTLRQAIKESLNTCFLQLITDLGPGNVVGFTKKLLGDNQVLLPGSDDPKYDAVPSFTLGTSEWTAYQRGAAIIPIANREGRAVKAHPYRKVTQGKRTVWNYVAAAPQVLDPTVAKTTFDTLMAPMESGGTAEGLGISGRRIMAKTGTDTKARTNAAVTFVAADQDSGLICSVAITDPNGRKLSGVTSRDAGEICHQFYQSVL